MLFIKDGLWSQWMQFQEVAVFDHAFKTISLLYVMSINIHWCLCNTVWYNCNYLHKGWMTVGFYLPRWTINVYMSITAIIKWDVSFK